MLLVGDSYKFRVLGFRGLGFRVYDGFKFRGLGLMMVTSLGV